MSHGPPLFVFAAMSPYSWLAAERIGALVADARWHPVFAGGLFRARGRVPWSLDGERRPAGMADCEARAAAHGLRPIRWPERWPTNDLLVARGMAVAEREGALEPFALAAMRLAFREGRDLAEPATVRAAAERAGLDPDALERDAGSQAMKDAVRAATDEAVALGVVGVPTVVIAGRAIWGDDRLEEAAALARA